VGGDLRKRINHYKNTKINEYKLKPMAQEREKEREIERERLLQKEREIERERLLQKERQSRLSLNNFTMGKKLGRGRFGSVYMAEEKQTGMVVALKLINCAQVREEQMEDQIMEEIKLQLFMNHPNILKMYGYFR
jgi:serine/threonine protein kinase